MDERQNGWCVLVAGATGAVGSDLVALLQRSSLPLDEIRLAASRGTTTPSMEVGDRRQTVHILPSVPEGSAVFEDVDLAFFCTPPDVTRAIAPRVVDMGVAVIDVGGALADQAPMMAPALGDHGLERFRERRLLSTPSAPALALATVMAPLVEQGAHGCHATLVLSAGMFGQAGMRELSSQVTSMFNNQTPPRKVFPSGLAFDLLAQVGDADESGWTGMERRIATEAALLCGLDPERVVATCIMAPVFSGISLSLHAHFEDTPPVAELSAALDSVEGVRLGDPVPGPKRLVGRSGLYVGRIRHDPSGDGAHLWASGDNVRFGASGNAVLVALMLDRNGLI